MNSTQSFHAANYQGNQANHDVYLRSDSSRPSTYGASVQSQYQGMQRQYQPVGNVQSFYGQNRQQFGGWQSQSFQPSAQMPFAGNRAQFASSAQNPAAMAGGMQAQSTGMNQTPQSFHTAQYRGSQPGHDQAWRGDSKQPTNMQQSFGQTQQAQQAQAQFGGYQSAFSGAAAAGGAQAQSQTPAMGAQAYHTAAYQGNQPGHDQYLRADSTRPAAYQGFGQFGRS